MKRKWIYYHLRNYIKRYVNRAHISSLKNQQWYPKILRRMLIRKGPRKDREVEKSWEVTGAEENISM